MLCVIISSIYVYIYLQAENLLSSYSADCAVVVFSVTDDGSLQEAREVLNILWQSGSLASRAVILVGNKTDLVRTRTVPIDGKFLNMINI